MDMPDDTPTKPHALQHSEDEIEQGEASQNFSSFESNGRQLEQSAFSLDEMGFKNLHSHRQKEMSFPEVPANLGKLYQIYMHNVSRKKELKKCIEELIEKQVKALRVAYDKETFSIQEFIDLEQFSKQYEISKKNYEQREAELEKLATKYKELKTMHVESMMAIDPIMKKTLSKYVQKNKEVLCTYVLDDMIIILCREKVKHRKLGKFKNKKGTKKLLPHKSGKSEEEVDDEAGERPGERSRNTSQTGSDQDDQEKQKFTVKNVIRTFNFYRTANGISFEPLPHLKELPANKQYVGFVMEPKSRDYLLYEKQELSVFKEVDRELQIKTSLQFDSPIIFCECQHGNVYVGTQDAVIRVYRVQDDSKLVLQKVAVCYHGEPEEVTHFAVTNNPEIVLFVKKSTHLCQINLGSYSTYLLSQLPEQVVHLDNRLILTKNCYYCDYYSSSGSHGKAILQHNEKLKAMVSAPSKKLVRLHRHKDVEYVILDEGLGTYSVQLL